MTEEISKLSAEKESREQFEKWFVAKYGFKPSAVDEVSWDAWLAGQAALRGSEAPQPHTSVQEFARRYWPGNPVTKEEMHWLKFAEDYCRAAMVESCEVPRNSPDIKALTVNLRRLFRGEKISANVNG